MPGSNIIIGLSALAIGALATFHLSPALSASPVNALEPLQAQGAVVKDANVLAIDKVIEKFIVDIGCEVLCGVV